MAPQIQVRCEKCGVTADGDYHLVVKKEKYTVTCWACDAGIVK